LFIFQTRKLQKLTSTISLQGSSNYVLKLQRCHLSTKSFNQLLYSNIMSVSSDGHIVDAGTEGKLRIFFYKFNKEHTIQCSNATGNHFPCMQTHAREPFYNSRPKLKKNLSWSFCLDPDLKLDLKKHFIDPESPSIDTWFCYPHVADEAHRMDALFNAYLYYLQGKKADVYQIKNPGSTNYYCQFSGGGDLLVTKRVPSSDTDLLTREISALSIYHAAQNCSISCI